jgi:hypothetical protein
MVYSECVEEADREDSDHEDANCEDVNPAAG